MKIFEQIDTMIDDGIKKYGEVAIRDATIITSAKGAVIMLRDMRAMQEMNTSKFSMTPDNDELFRYREIPVRLRLSVQAGNVQLVERAAVPAPTCCDKSAMQVMMIHISTAVA